MHPTRIRDFTMKKLIYGIVTASMLLCLQILNAQINLEHTFDGNVSWGGRYYIEQDLYPQDNYSVRIVNGNSYVLKIYNADYSLQSNNTYNFTPPTGYVINTVSISRKIFNTDDNYEFEVTYHNTSVNDNTRTKIILYNQSGSIIKDFGSAHYAHFESLHVANNQYRLKVLKQYYDGSNITHKSEIYSVPGTPPSGVSNHKVSQIEPPYPNPANSIITLPYQLKEGEMSVMRIFNMNGQLIETKQVDYVFDKILLNVSGYAKGIYIYEINGVSNRFIVH